MITIKIEDFNETIDIDKIANFAFKVRKNSGELNLELTVDSIKEDLENIRKHYKFILAFKLRNKKNII